MKQDKIYIYGKHALVEAITNSPQIVKKVFLANENDKEIMALLRKNEIPHSPLGKGQSVGDLEKDAKHQGVIGLIGLDRLLTTYEQFIKNLEVTPDTSLVIMGELQDPHNVGAVIRSAAAFGVAGVLIPDHNQAPVTGAVIKVSAGMAFRVPLVQVGNINNVISDLKKRGFWIYGLEGTSKQSIVNEKFDAPTAFVLGNEAVGIRAKTSELCDVLLSIPMHPQCESMNVASSTAVALYAWSTKHQKALKAN
jgi:23S rRNA (guanosine2251-2'-O)-methyltransferase